jgi:hypothetical protein
MAIAAGSLVMLVVKCAEKSDSPLLAQMGDLDDLEYGHLLLEEYATVAESWNSGHQRSELLVSIMIALPLPDDPRGYLRLELGIGEVATLLRWCAERRKDSKKNCGASLPRDGS